MVVELEFEAVIAELAQVVAHLAVVPKFVEFAEVVAELLAWMHPDFVD